MERNVNRLDVFGTGTGHSTLPEVELWTQVILRAINDLDGHRAVISPSAQDSAREWFASESDSVGSFIWTCQIIDVDPTFIRSQLIKKQRIRNPDEVAMTSMAQGEVLPLSHRPRYISRDQI